MKTIEIYEASDIMAFTFCCITAKCVALQDANNNMVFMSHKDYIFASRGAGMFIKNEKDKYTFLERIDIVKTFKKY